MKLAKRGSHDAKTRRKILQKFPFCNSLHISAPLRLRVLCVQFSRLQTCALTLVMNTSPNYTITQIHYFYICHSI